MALISTELFDRLTAQQNIPVALAYGRHLVAGNVVLRDDDTTNDITTLFVALGEGEWDSVEELRLNGRVLDSEQFHFHPGKDGETGTGGVTGDQKIDEWFPAGIVFSCLRHSSRDPNVDSGRNCDYQGCNSREDN